MTIELNQALGLFLVVWIFIGCVLIGGMLASIPLAIRAAREKRREDAAEAWRESLRPDDDE